MNEPSARDLLEMRSVQGGRVTCVFKAPRLSTAPWLSTEVPGNSENTNRSIPGSATVTLRLVLIAMLIRNPLTGESFQAVDRRTPLMGLGSRFGSLMIFLAKRQS